MRLTEHDIEGKSETELRALINTLETKNEELVEQAVEQASLREAGEFSTAQLALENIGWQPLAGIADSANSFTLEGLHRASELCRAVATVNPLVGRGLKVRTGYIWGAGVSVVPMQFKVGPGRPRTVNTTPTLPEGLNSVLTGTLAQIEIETSAATDGNLFFLVDKNTKTVQRVPFHEVTEGVSQKGNKERLLYVRRTWNDWDLDIDYDTTLETRPFTHPDPVRAGRQWMASEDPALPNPSVRYQSVWYPTGFVTNGRSVSKPAQILGQRVDYSKTIVHVGFNKLTGWRWGIPDILRAVWWTKAYKEYLENCSTLAKAYARFAWKITNEKSKSVRRTAAQVAQAPRTDPGTGQPLSVGASAVLGAGQDMAPVGGRGQVDFDAGRPLAAMIAAALDVPLPALTEDPSIGNRSAAETLDESTKLVMRARQRVMDEVYKEVFGFLGLRVRLRWPEIGEEPIHRRLQAIDMAVRLGLLSRDEARAMVLDAWGDRWDDFPAEGPTPDQLPYIFGNAETSEDGDQSSSPESPANDDSSPGAPAPLKAGNNMGGRPPKQVAPMSSGDHELRDEG